MGSGSFKFHIDWYEDYFEIMFSAADRAAVTHAAIRSAVQEAFAKVPEAKLASVSSFRISAMSKPRK